MRFAYSIAPALTLAFGLTAVATPTVSRAASDKTKVGYVDVNRALNEVADGKTAKTKLKTEFEARQKKLDAMQDKLKKRKNEFESRKAMMKPDVKEAKQEELQRQFLELQQTYMQLQQELMAQETKVTQEISEKLKKVIERIGDRDGYGMILNIGDTVLYHKRHRDITDSVVTEYNKLYAKK